MKKRILALLMALVLTVSCLPPTALAEGTQATEANITEIQSVEQTQPTLPENVEEETAPALNAAHGAHTCEHCADSSAEWKAWESGTDLPNATGHYYLTRDVVLDTTQTALKDGKRLTGASTDLVLCLNGNTVTSATRAYRVSDGAKLTITDCTGNGVMKGGKSIGGVIGVFSEGATGCQVSLYNVKLEGVAGNEPAYGGAISVYHTNMTLKLKNVTLSNFTTVGGASDTEKGGAAVYINAAGTSSLTMEGCTVTGCTDKSSANSGAVRVVKATTTSFKDCTFTGNSNTGTGASAIMLASTTATMSGCTVTGNSCAKDNWVGAVYVNPSAPLTLTGKNVIKDNTAKGATNLNLVLNEVSVAQFLSFTDASAASQLYITAERGHADPNGLIKLTAGDSVAFTYENDGKFYAYDKASSTFVLGHKHNDNYADISSAVWQKWDSKNSLPKSGHYYLTEDVDLTAAVSLNTKDGELAICLNGHTITTPDRIFRVSNGFKLTICDCGGKGILKTGASNGGAVGIFKDNTDTATRAATLTMCDVTVEGTEGKTPKQGGAISSTYPGATVKLKGVTFRNLTVNGTGSAATDTAGGSAIYMYSTNSDAKLYMDGCTVTGCSDLGTDYTGALKLYKVGTVELKDCSFTNNASNGNGGSAIVLSTVTNATMSGCTVTGNRNTSSSDWAGAVYLYDSAKLTLSGKNTIEGNTTKNGAASVDLMLQETTKDQQKQFLLFKDVDASSKLNITAKRGTTDPNKMMDASGDTFNITFGGDNYSYDVAQDKFTKDHKHTDGYAGVAASVTWQPWTKTDSLPTSGHYFLTDNVTIETVRFAEIKNDDLFLCLNGKTVTARAEGTDGKTNIFRLTGTGSLTICDCGAHTENGTYSAGTLTDASMGAIFTMGTATGTVNIYDGIFTDNASNDSGAVAVIQNTCQLYVYGGEFKNNTATNNGGAIYIGSKATATIQSGTFTGNTAGKDGGVIVNQGTLNLEGGKFTGNTAGTNGGAIHSSGAVLSISGSPEITGNTANGKTGNLYLATGKSLTLGTVGTGTAKVGISVASNTLPRTISNDMGSTDCTAYFFTDNTNWEIVKKDNKLYVQQKHTHTDGYAGVAASVIWQPWTKTDSLPTSGHYYLTANVTLTTRFAEIKNDDLFLCLNGKTVTARAEGTDGKTNIFRLTGSGSLTICDCGTNAGTLTGASMGAIFTMGTATGTVNIYNGNFTGNASNDCGAVAVMQNTCQLNIFGGQFQNNTATNSGGAIYIGSKATVTIHGGTFTGNTATKDGGAIISQGALHLKGGTFTGNTAGTNGGALHSGGTLSVSGTPEITGNTASGKTSNLYLTTGKSLTLGAVGTGTAKIGISVATNTLPRDISNDMGSADCTAYFFSDNADYEIIKLSNKLHIKKIFNHPHANDYAGVPSSTVWQPWTSKTSLPTSGYWVLTEDVTLSTVRYAEIKNSDLFLCLNGKTITARAEGTDGKTNIFRLTGTGNLTICDCTAHTSGSTYTAGKLTGASMGAIFTMGTASGTVNFYDGIITGNAASDSGAAAVIQGNCSFHMYGGEICGNTAAMNAGGVFAGGYSQVYIHSGKIYNNTAAQLGGGIYSAATLNISGGSITGNTAGTSGGGVFISIGSVTLSGNPEIKGNSVGSNHNNLYLAKEKLITLGDLAEDSAKIGISVSKDTIPRTLSNEMSGKDVSDYFFSDDPYRQITKKDNCLYLDHNSDHKHCHCADIGGDCGHLNRAWAPWAETDSLPTSGYWYLTSDVTVANADGITVTDDLQLCLNGHTINGNGHVILKIRNDKHDVLFTDCLGGGEITNGSAQNYGAIYLEKGSFTMFGGSFTNNRNTQTTEGGWSGGAIHARGQLTLTGVTFQGNTSTTEGGAICLRDGGKAELENCTFTGNSAKNGGAIYTNSNNDITITNCTFEGNTASVNGGAISARNSEVTLESGSFTGNTAKSHGGAFYLAGATLNVEGGKLTKNTAGVQGGAIFATECIIDKAAQASKINISGGEITKNKAPDGAAIATIRATEVKMTGGSINYNEAANAAGAILLQTGSKMTLSGDESYILYNKAGTEAGGIFVSSNSELTMNGGKVSANEAATNGGGIVVLGGKLTINDGHVFGNSANSGGGIYAKSGNRAVDGKTVADVGATVILSGGNISTNTATTDGGGVAIRGENTVFTVKKGSVQKNTAPSGAGILAIVQSKVNIEGGTVNNNTAKYSGGGIFMSYSTELNVSGGKITENTADSHGGGVYLLGVNMNLTGGEIIKNSAAVQGGGIFATYKDMGENTVYYSNIKMSGGKVNNNLAPDGAGIATIRYTKVNMTGGFVWGNEASASAGGILLQSGSEMTMSGEALVAKNIAAYGGGGIYVSSNSSLTMNKGAKITENIAGTTGGGVMLLGTTFTMNDGTVYGNQATSGGGVYAKHSGDVGGKFICKGGNFSTNTATTDGGGVSIYGPNTEFILDGGYLQKNTAPSGGGVLAVVESKVTVKDGSIVNNTAKSSGGGVFMSYTTEISISGGYISKNEAGSNGGGVNLLGSKLTITGGKISENQAKTQGGGVFATFKEMDKKTTYKSEINIRGGNINGNKAADGAGVATTRYTKVNMTGGTVSNNKASKSAAGILIQKYSVLNLSGGTISGNQAKYGGGGVFASTETTFNMNGGTISGNFAEGDGAGVHLLYSTGNFNGGTIQNNKATKSNAGGILVRGSKATMNGTDVLDNYAQKNGGGIVTVRYPNEKEGIDAQPELIINDGRIAGNRSGGPAGGMLLQSQAETKMTGGVIEDNYAKNYGGGVYVSMNHTFTVTGGKINGNESAGWGGGIYHLRGSVGHYENCEISYNKAASLGGGLIVLGTEAQPSAVTMKKVQVVGNEAREGAGVRTQDRFQTFQAEGCTFKENKATTISGGLMIFFGLEGVKVKDCLFENNTAGTQGAGVYVMSALKDCEITGCTFKGNVAGTEGGGMFTQGGLLVKGCTFDDNHATLEGGGIATDVFANTRVRHPVLYIEDCVISNNTSGSNGGGIYADTASYVNVSDTKITGNSSKAEGGGMWIVDDSTLHNVTVTGNRSGGEGYALYYHASEYDNRSYIRGAHKMGGEMIVKDNEGGDMYMGEQTGIAISEKGLTGDTYMNIRLHSGYLTQLLRGAYNYEGGDTIYTVTTGNRSLTDPEVFATAQQQEGEAGNNQGEGATGIHPAILVGGGALVVAAIAIVLILLIIGKKKKAAAGK